MATRSSGRAAVVLFSLITACLLGLGGFLGGSYLWGHYDPPRDDPDEIDAYFSGPLVGKLLPWLEAQHRCGKFALVLRQNHLQQAMEWAELGIVPVAG
jgi:hypothetical protein